jgi:hypothetical protein
MKTHRLAALLAGVALLQACSTQPERPNDWSARLPAEQHFTRVYESDAANAAVQTRAEYLSWVRSFYLGSTIYPWGFLDLEASMLEGLDAETAARVKARLDVVGMQIGAEWAKDRSATLIHTSTLSVWAEALQSSGEALESVIHAVADDVAAVLAGELQETAIAQERYGAPLIIAFDEQ